MSGEHKRQRYTMALAEAYESGKRPFGPPLIGFFTYVLRHPSGVETTGKLSDNAPVSVGEEDLHYAAILHAASTIPDGSHIEVVSARQSYHGDLKAAHPWLGTLNETAEDRRARRYRKKNKEPIPKREHLMWMDDELEKRRITHSGKHINEVSGEIGALDKLQKAVSLQLRRVTDARDGLAPEPEEWEY